MYFSFLKAELFRVSKMVSTYVLPIILLFIVLVNGIILCKVDYYGLLGMSTEEYETLTEQGSSAEGISQSFELGFNAGLDAGKGMDEEEVVPEINLWGEGIYYKKDVENLFQQNNASLSNILLLSIFVGLYIGDIYSHKYDRNLINACKRRGLLFSARLLVIAIYTLIMQILMWFMTVLEAALFAESVKINIDKSSIIYFIVSYLLTLAFGYLVMFITHFLRSKAGGISIGVVLASGTLTIIVSLFTLLAVKYLPVSSDFDFTDYFISQNLATLSLSSDGHVVVRAILCAIIYSAVFFVGSYFAIKKRDIA